MNVQLIHEGIFTLIYSVLENPYFPFMPNYYIIQEYRLTKAYKFSNLWLVSGNDYTD